MTGIVEGEEELGKQKRCPVCGEWWPLSPEFWYSNRSGELAVSSLLRRQERPPVGGEEGGPASMTKCANRSCCVLTPDRYCHGCRETIRLLRAGLCVSCKVPVEVDAYGEKWSSRCADCVSENRSPMGAATARLCHQYRNAMWMREKRAAA